MATKKKTTPTSRLSQAPPGGTTYEYGNPGYEGLNTPMPATEYAGEALHGRLRARHIDIAQAGLCPCPEHLQLYRGQETTATIW